MSTPLNKQIDSPGKRTLGEAAPESDASEISLIGLLNVLLRHRLVVVALPILLVIMGVVPALRGGMGYTAETTFLPASGGSSTSVAKGLSAQLGLGSSTSDLGESPDFYIDLMQSREILRPVVEAKYKFRGSAGRVIEGDLMQIYKAGGATRALREDAVVNSLRQSLDASASLKTSVITLKVTAPEAELARQIAQNILDAVVRFNREKRQSRNSQEVAFITARLADAASDLRLAENRMQQFLEENREFRTSPKLTFEQDRLAREVTLRQQLYTNIVNAFESAKIDRVRESAVITIIEEPETPLRPNGKGLRKKVMLNLFMGLMLGIAIAFLLEFFSATKREENDDTEEFGRLWRQLLQDFRHPLAAIKRPLAQVRKAAFQPHT